MNIINAITYLKDFNTDGHHPVLVLGDDLQKYVIKPYRSQKFDYCIYNEILANKFLQLWDIETPDMALVKVEPEILKNSNNALEYKKESFEKYFFGSRYIDNSIELNNFLNFSKAVDYKKIKSPEKFIFLGLFDIWVENDDRKPSNFNILLNTNHSKFTITAIDNAFIFSSLTYLDLNPEFVSVSVNDNVLYSTFTKQILKKIKVNSNWVKHQQELFYLCIHRCQDHFDEIVNQVSPFIQLSEEDYKSLKHFLFSEERNKQVFNEFLSRLKK